MRTVIGGILTLQSAMLAFVAIGGACAWLPGLDRLPQAIAGLAFALGLIAVFPMLVPTRPVVAAVRALCTSRPMQRWIAPVAPLQFAAVVLVLMVAAAERLPRWVPDAIAFLRADFADDNAVQAAIGWILAAGLGGALGLLLVGFTLALVLEALGYAEPPRGEAANTVMLWNVLTGVLAAISDASYVFGGAPGGPEDWQWWLALGFALAVARSTLVVWALFASDHVGSPMQAVLAPKDLGVAIGVAIGRRATAAALGMAVVVFVVLERLLGVADAATLIALASSPAARALARWFPRETP